MAAAGAAMAVAAAAMLALPLFNGGCRAPRNGALAYYCSADDSIHLNHRAIADDAACGLCYFRNPTTAAGHQKAVVFGRMDPDGRRLRRWLDRQPDGRARAYARFILEHERAHQALHRHSHTGGLMSEATIAKEVEANLWAYRRLGI